MLTKIFNFMESQHSRINYKLGIRPGLMLESDINIATTVWFLIGWCLCGFICIFLT